MPEESLLEKQTPDALMLFGFWYRALPSDELKRGELRPAMLLEQPLVVGRDQQGRAFALRDACPHRGMPLSCGRFDGGEVECSYHGWRFDAHSGQCTAVPSVVEDQNSKSIAFMRAVIRAKSGMILCGCLFLIPGRAGAGFTKAAPAPTPTPEIPKFSDAYKLAYLTADLPARSITESSD